MNIGSDDPAVPINAKAEVTVTGDARKAHTKLLPPQNGGARLTYDALAAAVREKGVICGLREEVLTMLSATPIYEKPELIAVAIEPIPGTPGSIEYCFRTSRDRKPLERSDGSVDLKQLGVVQNVLKDDVLCLLNPPIQGTPGSDVLGRPINVKQLPNIVLSPGPGTVLSDDKLTLLAAIDGQVDLVGKRVTVNNALELDGDIGLATGNIDFVGNVSVSGNVLLGFTVKAGGNITIKGCIDGGVVEAGGNVLVENSINGMGSGRVIAGGDLRCKYIQNCVVHAGQNIDTGMCLASRVTAGGIVRVTGANAGIINSNIIARHAIYCVNAGTETAAHMTILETGSDPITMKRFSSIPAELDAARDKLGSLERLITLFQQLEQQGRLTEEKGEELRRLLLTRQSTQQIMADLMEERLDIEEKMTASGYGTINVSGTIYSGARIVIGSETMVIKTAYKYTTFKRTAEGIIQLPYTD